MPTLLLYGCGKMGGALLAGWRSAGITAQFDDVYVFDKIALASHDEGHIFIVGGLDVLTVAPEVVVLAVKPDQLDEVLADCKARFAEADPLYISIAAGREISFYQARLNEKAKVIRVMPNLPATVGKGVAALTPNPYAGEADKELAERLFAAVGKTLWVDEAQMHAVTALSGSGPAYLYYFLEALSAAGEALGLAPGAATELARETVIGASRLLEQSGDAAAHLRKNVTSPGGTTEAGIAALDAAGFREAVHSALSAAAARSEELSGI